MLLQDLMRAIPGTSARGDTRVEIRGLCCDSRQAAPGFLFVALRGARDDGNRYVGDALARGAVALASEQEPEAPEGIPRLKVADARSFLAEAARIFYGDPAARMKLAAVTGTNGKTTTAWLIDSIFRQAGLRSCLAGTLGMRTGANLHPSSFTTPEACELARFLRTALDEGCTHGALEVSSHALASRRVFGMKFHAAAFSNLTPEHLDFHGDMDSYYAAKRLLFTGAGRNGVEVAAINADDPYGRRLIGEAECRVLRYGIEQPAEVRLLRAAKRADGSDIAAATPAGDIALRTHLIGTPNIYNVLAAIAVALSFGIDTAAIRSGIEAVAAIPGRLELVSAGQDFTVLVDYAHTPDALAKLLETVAELPHRRIITVFGCGGDRDRRKRPLMGEIAGRLSDQVIATSDNPRSEDPLAILAEIEPGLRRAGAAYRIEPDRRRAITLAVSMARRGDAVVIAGKGHEDYQIVGTQVLPFDDRAVARAALARLHDTQGARN